MLDTGLVNFTSGIDKEIYNSSELTDVYMGRIAEHIIGQELLAGELTPDYKLLFWVREKKQANAEINYIITYDGKFIPVEVKSGSVGRLKSLYQFVNLSGSKLAVRFYSSMYSTTKEKTNEGNEFTLLNMPFYLCNKINDYLRINDSFL